MPGPSQPAPVHPCFLTTSSHVVSHDVTFTHRVLRYANESPASRSRCMLALPAAFCSHQFCTCQHYIVNSSVMSVQVLRLQSSSASPDSPPVDHASGIEAMILAILQQANYSQHAQLDTLAKVVLQLVQDDSVEEGLLLDALAKLLADAQTSNAVVQARLGSGAAPSLLPVSHSTAVCMQRWHCLRMWRQCSVIATSQHYGCRDLKNEECLLSVPCCRYMCYILLLLVLVFDCPCQELVYRRHSSNDRA